MSNAAPPTPASRLPRWKIVAIAGAVATAFGLLLFGYHYLDVLVRGRTEPIHVKLIEELNGAYGALLLFPVIIWLVRRIGRLPWLAAIPTHFGAAVAVSALHTTWNWVSRLAVYRVLGYGHYDYGNMRLRYFMELPNDLIWYAVFASLILLFDHYREARNKELKLAQLEAELSRVKLQSLEAQLHPHFLFNALNTVSSVMYEDVAAADAILSRLGDLLRRTLNRRGDAEVPLAEELETLELYLDILRVRFAERLEVRVEVEPGARDAAVPQLILQPLVENAVKHGDPGPGRPARITLRARRENGALSLEVEDNGPGLPKVGSLRPGVGLDTTRRRLEQLYGDRQRLSFDPGAEGGLRVGVAIPYRRAEPEPARHET
jgi:signal transduction histidine kinase